MGARAANVAWGIALATIGASLAAVLVFVAGTFGTRLPYWGEAEPVFEAARLRQGLPLFVDPLVGAVDLGEPPSRWLVTYPPIWSALLALLPPSLALGGGRVLATGLWFGALGLAVRAAPKDRRRDAAVCAAIVGGSWVLANFATIARPDALACAIAVVALVRSARRGAVGPAEAVLFALVPFVKPTVLGLPAGALLADELVRMKPHAFGVAAGAAVILGLGLHLGSGGVLLAHVVGSNAQPMTFAAWMDHVPSRLPFFLPLFALALHDGWADRRAPGAAIATGALVGALGWVLVALAKTGSASNYWMEPCVAAVVVVACSAPGPFRVFQGGLLHGVAALVYALYVGVASIGASLEHLRDYRADAAFVATVRDRCGAGPSDLVAADEAGIELALDGRILATTYQTAWLVNAGRFPASTWTGDLASPRVRCFVVHSGDLAPAPEVARFVEAAFVPKHRERGFRVLGKR